MNFNKQGNCHLNFEGLTPLLTPFSYFLDTQFPSLYSKRAPKQVLIHPFLIRCLRPLGVSMGVVSENFLAETEGISTPDRIVATGEKMLVDEGSNAVSLRAITRAGGVTLAAIHYHKGG